MHYLGRSLLLLALLPAGAAYSAPGQPQSDVPTARDDRPPPLPPGGPDHGPGPGRGRGGKHGPREERDPGEEGLQPMTATGKIQSLAVDPRGRVDGILFIDGTSARAGRRGRLETLGLKAGDTVTVTGRGGTYPQGRSLHIETIKLPSGEVKMVEPPRAVLTPVSRDGEVARVLINPHGDVDGLVLKDGVLIRLRPTASNPQLATGVKIRAEGEGTATFIHADRVTITATGTVLDFSSGPPARPAPRPLATVEDSSSVAQVLNNPEGEVDTLVLQDGSIVKVSPRLRDDVGGALKVGVKLAASGEGGTYGAVKAFLANRLQFASGQVFSDPERPGLPRPPRNVTP